LNCAKAPVTTRLLSNTSERDKARDQVGDVTWSLYFFVYVVYADDLTQTFIINIDTNPNILTDTKKSNPTDSFFFLLSVFLLSIKILLLCYDTTFEDAQAALFQVKKERTLNVPSFTRSLHPVNIKEKSDLCHRCVFAFLHLPVSGEYAIVGNY
jgi:hypothetical protein